MKLLPYSMKLASYCLPMVLVACLAPAPARAEVPRPSVFQVAWEFKFSHATPKRVSVQLDGQKYASAFWYLTYTVTNPPTDSLGQRNVDRLFMPVFEMVTEDGRVIRADNNISMQVFDAIKRAEGNKFLEPAGKVSSVIRIGEDQAREGVAIWPEPAREMGNFSIFVSGLSGEQVRMKKDDGNNLVKVTDEKQLRDPAGLFMFTKTLQLNYIIHGDDVYPGDDKVNENPEEWIMR